MAVRAAITNGATSGRVQDWADTETIRMLYFTALVPRWQVRLGPGFQVYSPMPETLPACTLCPPEQGVILANDCWTLVLNRNQATLGRVFFALRRHETDLAALSDT